MTFKYRYRKQIITVSLLVLLIIGSITSYIYLRPKKKINVEKNILLFNTTSKKEKVVSEKIIEVMVDVKGEVNSPGIYTLKSNSRVIDALNMAGGVTNNADTSVLNLSKKLSDEMVIIVYSYYEVRNFSYVKEVEKTVNDACGEGVNGVSNNACIESDTDEDTGMVSINTGTKEDLMTLTGIGEAKASDIIKYREENGLFEQLEDIKNVSGIGDSLFDKIKENITL